MITDFSFFKDALMMIETQPLEIKLACVLGFYAAAPLCGIPITVEVPLILTYGNKVSISNVRILQTIFTSLKIILRKIT